MKGFWRERKRKCVCGCEDVRVAILIEKGGRESVCGAYASSVRTCKNRGRDRERVKAFM